MPSKKGFTLIELLVVIAILASLGALTIVSFRGSQQTARDARRKSDLKQYQTALESFANRNNGLYPARTAATNPNTLCGAALLNVTGCASDPLAAQAYNYQSNGTNGSNNAVTYALWATLEKPVGGVQFLWVVCSTGRSGRVALGTTFINGACPAVLLP